MTSSPSPDKRIFVSDIHRGDGRSMKLSPQHPHPYGWLSRHMIKLTNFLRNQLDAPDVGQGVILGDLFDQWVLPTDFDPLERLDSICRNPVNKGIINNLKFQKKPRRETEALILKYPFVSECRMIARRIEEEKRRMSLSPVPPSFSSLRTLLSVIVNHLRYPRANIRRCSIHTPLSHDFFLKVRIQIGIPEVER